MTAVGPLDPADDRTLVIDDAGTLSLHLPCNVLGIVIGPQHYHGRTEPCGWMCTETAQHVVHCDDVAGHVGEHRARYHSGSGWPVGYFTADDTLKAPASSGGEAGASADGTTVTEPDASNQNVAQPTDTRPPGSVTMSLLGLAMGTASGMLLAAGFAQWTGVL